MKQKQRLILLHNESVASTCQLALLLIFPLALSVNQHSTSTPALQLRSEYKRVMNVYINLRPIQGDFISYQGSFLPSLQVSDPKSYQLGSSGQSKSTLALNTEHEPPSRQTDFGAAHK